MISVGEHRQRILAAATPLPTETVGPEAAEGRCLAEDAFTRWPVPPWDNSAMDGYAVRAADLAAAGDGAPVDLNVTAEIPAGTTSRPVVGPGEAARIMTGAPMPEGADTVVPIEEAEGDSVTVRIAHTPETGRHVRRAGEDRREGELVAGTGTVVTPEVVSALVSTGHSAVTVAARPRVAVISTGDELVPVGTEPGFGRIPDSNRPLVAGLVRRSGGVVAFTGHAGDGPGELEAELAAAEAEADVIILTGGVSVGDRDPVKALFAGGNTVRFDRVAMQPGKPQAFGRLDSGALLFGLPGNPVSAWVSFHVFARPCLRAMQGYAEPLDRAVPARAATGWNGPTRGRTQFLPVVISSDSEGRTVAPAGPGGSGSHLVASLAAVNGYAIVTPENGPVAAGDRVPTVLTGSEHTAAIFRARKPANDLNDGGPR